MARLNHSNTAVRTSLSSAISDTDTSLTVGDATGYPSVPFAIEIGDEVIRVDSKSGTTFSSLQRGYDGTTAASHASGSAVQHAGISEDFEEAYQLFDIVTAAAGNLPTSDGSSVVSQGTGSDNDLLHTDTGQSNNLNFSDLATLLENTILTSNGDLLYRNGSGNVVSLGVGSSGQELVSDGSVPTWREQSYKQDHATSDGTSLSVSVSANTVYVGQVIGPGQSASSISIPSGTCRGSSMRASAGSYNSTEADADLTSADVFTNASDAVVCGFYADIGSSGGTLSVANANSGAVLTLQKQHA